MPHTSSSTPQTTSWLARLIFALGFILILLVAIITLSLRLALPQLDKFQPEILHWLNQQNLPFTLELASISGKVEGFNLHLQTEAIQLAANTQEEKKELTTQNFFQLDKINLELNSLASILAAKPIFNKLSVDGLEVWLEETSNGWQLLGFPTEEKNSAPDEEIKTTEKTGAISPLDALLSGLELLLAQGELTLTNLRLNLLPLANSTQPSNTSQQVIQLLLEEFNYQPYEGGWQFNLALANNLSPDDILQLKINLAGDKLKLANSQLEAWLHLPQLTISKYAHLLPAEIASRLTGQLAVEGWLNWQNGFADGHLELNQLKLAGINLKPFQQGRPAAKFKSTASLGINQASVSFSGIASHWQANWLVDGLQINQQKLHPLKGTYRLNGHSHRLRLADLDISQLNRLARQVTPLIPELDSVLASLKPQGRLSKINAHLPANNDWQVTAQLNNIRADSWSGTPKGSNLNGHLMVNADGGEVTFATSGLEIGFPDLYSFLWRPNFAKGKVSWKLDLAKNSVWIIGENLAVELAHQPKSRAARQKPMKVSGNFSLLISPQENKFYLNLGLLPTSVLAQRQLAPSLLLPEEVANWLADALPQGQLNSTGFIYAGTFDEPVYQLITSFQGTEFKFQPDWPSVTQAAGRFELHNGWVKGLLTQAKLGDARLNQVRFATRPARGRLIQNNNADQLVSLNTRLAAPTHLFSWLVEHTPLKAEIPEALHQWEFGGQLTGNLKLGLNLNNPEKAPEVELSSQLKDASLKISQIDLQLDQLNGPLNFSLAKGLESAGISGKLYGEELNLKFLQPQQRLEFNFNLSATNLGEYLGTSFSPEIINGSTQIEGELALEPLGDLNLSSNLKGLSYQLIEPFSKSATRSKNLLVNFSLAEEASPLVVQIGEDFSLAGIFLPKSTQIDFTSSIIQGQLVFPSQLLPLTETNNQLTSASSYKIELDYLKLPPLAQEAETTNEPPADKQKTAATDPLANLDLNTLKPVRFKIKELYLGANKLGGLEVHLQPTAQGFKLQPIIAKLKDSQFNGQLKWQQSLASQFSGRLSGTNLQPAFSNFTAEPLPLTSKQHQFDIHLNWPASPLAFNLADASGELNFQLKEGSFSKGSGELSLLTQVISLVNIDSLLNRLKIGVSDLGKKGVSYISLEGKYQLKEGILSSLKPTQVTSSATSLSLSGEINLLTEEIDKQLKVVLPVAQSLPMAAILVGAPQIGAGIWLTQKLFGKEIDKVSQATYSIKGSLSEPQVKLEALL